MFPHVLEGVAPKIKAPKTKRVPFSQGNPLRGLGFGVSAFWRISSFSRADWSTMIQDAGNPFKRLKFGRRGKHFSNQLQEILSEVSQKLNS